MIITAEMNSFGAILQPAKKTRRAEKLEYRAPLKTAVAAVRGRKKKKSQTFNLYGFPLNEAC